MLGSPSIQTNADVATMDVGAEQTGGAAAVVVDAIEEDAVRVGDVIEENSVQLGFAHAGDNAIETDFIELCTIESDEENDVIEIYRAPAASKVVVGCVERVNVIEIDLT